MDSLKSFNLAGVDLKKKFKDVRRRTTQKVAESLGVADIVQGDEKIAQDYRNYVWLGNYLEKFKAQVITSNTSMHRMIQSTFTMATQLQAELTPEEDEQPLPPQLKRIYARDPENPSEMYNRTDVIVGTASDLFSAQAYINGEPLQEYFDNLKTFIIRPITKELEQNDSLTEMMLEECEEARLDYAAYQRTADKSEKNKIKADNAKFNLDEANLQLKSHLETRIAARCSLMTSTMAFLVQLQATFHGNIATVYDRLAAEALPQLQLCQLDTKVVQKRRKDKKTAKTSGEETQAAAAVQEEPTEVVSSSNGHDSAAFDLVGLDEVAPAATSTPVAPDLFADATPSASINPFLSNGDDLATATTTSTTSQASVDFFGDSSTPNNNNNSGSGLDDIFGTSSSGASNGAGGDLLGGLSALVPDTNNSSGGGGASLGGLGGLTSLDMNAQLPEQQQASPLQPASTATAPSSSSPFDDILSGGTTPMTASSSQQQPSQQQQQQQKSSGSYQPANWDAISQHTNAQRAYHAQQQAAFARQQQQHNRYNLGQRYRAGGGAPTQPQASAANPFAAAPSHSSSSQAHYEPPKHYANHAPAKAKAPDPTDNPLRQRAKAERLAGYERAAAQKVAELHEQEAQEAQVAQQKQALDAEVSGIVDKWANAGGKKGNLRALLSSIQDVLWPDSGWKPVSLAELMDPKRVRRFWLKAVAIVHPDKVQGEDVRKQLLAERIFNVLRDTFDVFKEKEL